MSQHEPCPAVVLRLNFLSFGTSSWVRLPGLQASETVISPAATVRLLYGVLWHKDGLIMQSLLNHFGNIVHDGSRKLGWPLGTGRAWIIRSIKSTNRGTAFLYYL